MRAREHSRVRQDLARKRLRETARPNYYLHMWGEAKYFQVSTLEYPWSTPGVPCTCGARQSTFR